jgi:hypothetical protein
VTGDLTEPMLTQRNALGLRSRSLLRGFESSARVDRFVSQTIVSRTGLGNLAIDVHDTPSRRSLLKHVSVSREKLKSTKAQKAMQTSHSGRSYESGNILLPFSLRTRR